MRRSDIDSTTAAASSAPAAPTTAPKDPDIRRLEASLADTLGASVQIRAGRGGKGKLEISYNSLDELDGILAHIQ